MAMRNTETDRFVSWPREAMKIVIGSENEEAVQHEAHLLVLRLKELREETAGMLADIDQSIEDAEALRDGDMRGGYRSRRKLLDALEKIEGTRDSLSEYQK